jgi:hypothetical protein
MSEVQRVEAIIQRDRPSMKNCAPDPSCAGCCQKLCVKLVAAADCPTDDACFRMLGFANNERYLKTKKGRFGHWLYF